MAQAEKLLDAPQANAAPPVRADANADDTNADDTNADDTNADDASADSDAPSADASEIDSAGVADAPDATPDATTDATAPARGRRRITALAPEPPPTVMARRPTRAFRFLRAYWVTFTVIASYLSVRFQTRFRSRDAIAQLLIRKHIKNAKRIERAIVALQGLFIKVGQLISIMTNFLPEEFRRELEGLQDQVPAHPFDAIERRITEELGQPPDALFASFERVPVASASIGQVHIAHLPNGDKVAVKVQHPGIESLVRSDLRTLRRIFRIVGYFVQYDGLEEVYREIRAMILEELDFAAEAENIHRIAQNFADRPDVAFPTPVPQLSTSRVLTTLFEDGVKVSDLTGLSRLGIDRKALARRVIELYCQQIFTDGVYHADPHPGNLLVRACDGDPDHLCVVFLDFGAVAEISPEMRAGIIELLQAALTRDSERIVRSLKQMGFIARGADDRVFDQVVEYLYDRFQEEISLDSFNLKDIKFDPEKKFEYLADLRRMDISLRELTQSFHVPKEWILLERTLLLLTGLCTELDPTLNPMTVIRPYLERFVFGDDGDWQTLVVNTTKDLVLSAAALPGDMRKVMRTALSGDLSVRFRGVEQSSRIMYRLGHQAIFVAIGVAGAAIAIVLEGRGELARAEYGWWTARIAGGLLVWSWWTTRSLLRNKR